MGSGLLPLARLPLTASEPGCEALARAQAFRPL